MKRFLLLPFLFFACSGLEQSQRDRLMEANATREPIYRNEEERVLVVAPEPQRRERYPWEERRGTLFPRITKEYFRCRGVTTHPPIQANNKGYYLDCGGYASHSLPTRDGEEFIYPRLIELLNFVQEEAKQRVRITCGHRCPDHNRYAEPQKSSSYHMIGAEVDFYVENFSAEKVVGLLQKALDAPLKRTGNVWKNDEVTIRLYPPGEGRDIDNQHDLPYLALQLRKSEGKTISYTWHQANKGFYRW